MVKKINSYTTRKDKNAGSYKSNKLDNTSKPGITNPEKDFSKNLIPGTKKDPYNLTTDPNDSINNNSDSKNLPIVKEPLVSYSQNLISSSLETNRGFSKNDYNKNFTILLSDAANKPEAQMMPLEKMSIVRTGVSKKDLEGLKEKTALDYDKLAKALSVTRATLINKKREEKFNASLSERIVGLADIYSYGYEVFEDEGRFNQWMFRPNRAMGGQAPFELIDNQFGREEVRNIIGRIAYGVYS